MVWSSTIFVQLLHVAFVELLISCFAQQFSRRPNDFQSITTYIIQNVIDVTHATTKRWAFEALALLCGILPGDEAIIGIGANAIILNVSSTTYMVYMGMSVAGNVRLGNALGAGDAHRARVASNLTLSLGAITALINIGFLLSTRTTLPWCFTTDVDIAKEAEHLFVIAACYQLPDAINGAVQGIFRGSGRQALAAQWNFVAYYCIGIPLAYVFGIAFGGGVEGLWWGITVGLSVIATGCTGIVLRSDWEAFSSEAKARMNGGEG